MDVPGHAASNSASEDDTDSFLDGSGFDESSLVAGNGVTHHTLSSSNIRDTLSKASQDASSGVQASLPSGEAEDESENSTGAMSLRAYQLEMLDQSLKKNAIVAMDTGSGKTQVAVLRIKAELEKGVPEKIIWFLAPTVSLCAQQFEVIKLQIPAANMRMLTGNDNVDTWNDGIWKVILDGVAIVISTYQILLDAMNHAFITMEQLSLIVFDEVHNCTGKSAGNKIMADHYQPRKLAGKKVPAILGLTATPSVRSDVHDLERLETIMDAKCVSPTLHRDELLKCVKRPQITHLTYTPRTPHTTPSMRSLQQAYFNLDIRRDPYILGLRADPTDRNKRALIKAIEKYDTYSQGQLKGFSGRALEVCQQLGPWAADFYISKIIEIYLRKVGSGDEFFDNWLSEDKKYIAEALRQQPDDLSEKANLLINALSSADNSVVGIIFVKERAMVTMLSEVLRLNPLIKEKYRIGTMVGTSNNSGRKRALYEFAGAADLKSLQNFRSGKLNLLIATSVLEEGIDVPACNLVICFDNPATPKSFIQRRGRARMKDSHLVLFLESTSTVVMQWEVLESEMRLLYEDEEREFRRMQKDEESENGSDACFVVESTGARLDFDNAKSHLEHFCRVLAQGEYVDGRPDYIIHRHTEGWPGILSATVLLPSFVPAELRQAESSTKWRSEKNATKDAAFQAYVALYKAKLINEHLLPLKSEDITGPETRAAEVSVEPLINPWIRVSGAWLEPSDKWSYSLGCIDEYGQAMGSYEVALPVWLNQPLPMQLYLDRDKKWELRISEGRPIPHAQMESMPDHTSALLAFHFGHRWQVEERPHVVRVTATDAMLSMDQIGIGKFDLADEEVKQGRYLIRDNTKTPFLYRGLIPVKPLAREIQRAFFEYETAPSDVPYLDLWQWTKRSDLLHPTQGDARKEIVSTKLYQRVLPLSSATVDIVPVTRAQFGMTIPCLIHQMEVMLIAKELAETLLQPVGISNLDLVREAICSRSAGEPVHYERLEFLGDSILKFCTSIQASAENPDWPEGYLSFYRDRLVSNSRLSRATQESGLAKFIIVKAFTGHKWRPLYLDTHLQVEQAVEPERKMSTKTLADVVEALIGASYVEGGLPKALKCISFFLGEREWKDVGVGRQILFDLPPANEPLSPLLAPLEELIGYKFQKKALLIESMTHASYIADTGKRSLERLEFLGDAILDNIIVTKVFASKPSLPHHRMHTLKTAMVNGDFIAFMTMEHRLRVSESVVVTDAESTTKVTTQDTYMYLWEFMRHSSISIGLEQKETKNRHMRMRDSILELMKHGNRYPWDLLAHLQPKKFYSDLFEALLGAVWIDSGSIDTCKEVVRRFGMLDYLDRIMRDEVHCLHPKEHLGMLAATESVAYILDARDRSNGEKEHLCKVIVGKRVVVEVDDGVNREEVKTKAAQAAVEVLLAEKANGEMVMSE
ncbi:Dicer-like protein 2 [Cladobotryum mycophilum]|uniref:Dicer-like protein 2 n=1 Tax=Cladobotryum mycophilum TaxID=491253 RepID=A0ABR0SC03_9HYPO